MQAETKSPIDVPSNSVSLHPALPRTRFPKDELNRFAASMKQATLLNAPVGRKIKGSYELLSGAKRFAAAKVLRWKSLPIRLVDVASQQAAWAIVGVEQQTRSDWSMIERATYLQGLCDPDRGGYTQQQAAELMGWQNRSTVCHHLALLELPDVARHLLHVGELLDLARGRILCKYRERPEIVDAICHALERNPEAWTPRRNFEQSAARIASRFDAGPEQTTAVSNAGPRRNSRPAAETATARTAARRATPEPPANLDEPPPATRPITQTEIVSFLKPFEYDVESLRRVYNVTRSWIRALEEAMEATA